MTPSSQPPHPDIRPPRRVSLWQVHAKASWMVDPDAQLTAAGAQYISTELGRERDRHTRAMRAMVLLLMGSLVTVVVHLIAGTPGVLTISPYLSFSAGMVGVVNASISHYRYARVRSLLTAVQRWALLPEDERQRQLAQAT